MVSQFYLPRFPRLMLGLHQLQGLMNVKLPRLATHLFSVGVHPTMYATQWLLTIFTYNFPFAIVVRVWDSFLYEGWKVVFRVALAVLKIAEREFSAPRAVVCAVRVCAVDSEVELFCCALLECPRHT